MHRAFRNTRCFAIHAHSKPPGLGVFYLRCEGKFRPTLSTRRANELMVARVFACSACAAGSARVGGDGQGSRWVSEAKSNGMDGARPCERAPIRGQTAT